MKITLTVELLLDYEDLDKFDEFNVYVDDQGYDWNFKPHFDEDGNYSLLRGIVTAGNLTPAEAENFIQYCLRFHVAQEPA